MVANDTDAKPDAFTARTKRANARPPTTGTGMLNRGNHAARPMQPLADEQDGHGEQKQNPRGERHGMSENHAPERGGDSEIFT